MTQIYYSWRLRSPRSRHQHIGCAVWALVLIDSLLTLSLHGRWLRGYAQASFIKALVLFMKALSLWPSHLTKVFPSNTSTLGLRISTAMRYLLYSTKCRWIIIEKRNKILLREDRAISPVSDMLVSGINLKISKDAQAIFLRKEEKGDNSIVNWLTSIFIVKSWGAYVLWLWLLGNPHSKRNFLVKESAVFYFKRHV